MSAELSERSFEATLASRGQPKLVDAGVFSGELPLEQLIVLGSADELGSCALTDRELLGEAGDRRRIRRCDLDEQEELVSLGCQAVLPDYPFAVRAECAQSESKICGVLVVGVGGMFSRDFVVLRVKAKTTL